MSQSITNSHWKMEKSSRRCGKCCRKRLQCHTSRPVSCAHIEQLIMIRQWMKKVAEFRNSLIPAIFVDTGRGLMTKKSIQPGEIIVSLPVKLLITTKTVLDSDIGRYIKCWKPKLTPQQCLAVFLIWERDKSSKSPWLPYIKTLPSSFTSPAYFTVTELSFLPKSVRLKIKQELEKLNVCYREVQVFCKHHWHELYDCLSFDVFKWAWYAINSRSVYYELPPSDYLNTDEPDNLALAPWLDLLNHSPQANITAGYNTDTDCYEITTFDSYKPYNQVFISYGNHSNQQLFIEYGFCVPDNPNDVFEVTYDDILTMCKHFSVKYLDKKLDILRCHDLLKDMMCTMEGVSWKLLTVCKTLAMEWRHLQHWNQIFTETAMFDELLPVVNSMISYMLQPYLDDNNTLQKQLQTQIHVEDYHPDHLQIIAQILTVEKSILTKSIQE